MKPRWPASRCPGRCMRSARWPGRLSGDDGVNALGALLLADRAAPNHGAWPQLRPGDTHAVSHGNRADAGDAFRRQRDKPVVLGVLVISLGNLYALEKLHGMAAVNHALFVCAGRLRRAVPADVEMRRFSTDGFLLLLRDFSDSGQLSQLAHRVGARLSKPVVLNTSLTRRGANTNKPVGRQRSVSACC